jgi:NTP pyrophosphatase (non-canonical NTP hydrolase)
MFPSSPTSTVSPMLTFGHLNTLAASHLMNSYPSSSTRNIILQVTGLVGALATSFLKHAPLDRVLAVAESDDTLNPGNTTDTAQTPATATPPPSSHTNTNLWIPPREIRLLLGQIFFYLAMAAASCQLDLHHCIETKLVLNAKKYPVELCKGKSGKYTVYSEQTGITKTQGQTSTNDPTNDIPTTHNSTSSPHPPTVLLLKPNHNDPTTLDVVQTKITDFANERLWNRFHTPRNLVLALIGELGELAELFQWKGDCTTTTTTATTVANGTTGSNTKLSPLELEQISQEIADVAIYLLRLAAVCRVKIGDSTLEACAQMVGK